LRFAVVVMNPREPKLDWIKKVLSDPLVGRGERAADASLKLVSGTATAPSDCQSIDDRLVQPGDDDRLVCLSWQLIRLTAAMKSCS
jgi:hypothetical protein